MIYFEGVFEDFEGLVGVVQREGEQDREGAGGEGECRVCFVYLQLLAVDDKCNSQHHGMSVGNYSH